MTIPSSSWFTSHSDDMLSRAELLIAPPSHDDEEYFQQSVDEVAITRELWNLLVA